MTQQVVNGYGYLKRTLPQGARSIDARSSKLRKHPIKMASSVDYLKTDNMEVDDSEDSGPRPVTLLKCPPYCRSNCVMQHHPLLVALLNCVDSEDKNKMELRMRELKSVVRQYREMGWNQDKEVIDVKEIYRMPLMHWACALGRINALKWMLTNQFSAVSMIAETGDTALHKACMSLQESCPTEAIPKFRQILPLMEQSLAVQNKEGDTPLHYCCEMLQNGMPCVDFFRDCISAMVYYAKQKSEAFQVIFLNTQNAEGNTALHLLAHNNKHYNLIKMMVQAGTNTKIMNSKGMTPLSIALESCAFKLASYFSDLTTSKLGIKNEKFVDTEPLLDKDGTVIGQVVRRFGFVQNKDTDMLSDPNVRTVVTVTPIAPQGQGSNAAVGAKSVSILNKPAVSLINNPPSTSASPPVQPETVTASSSVRNTPSPADSSQSTVKTEPPMTDKISSEEKNPESTEDGAEKKKAGISIEELFVEKTEHALIKLIENGDDALRKSLYDSVKQENILCRRRILLLDHRVQAINKKLKLIERETIDKSQTLDVNKKRLKRIDEEDLAVQSRHIKAKQNFIKADEANKSLQARLRHCQSALDALKHIQ